MEQQVYKKEGRRYKPIGYSDGWRGFPAEGVWIVQRKDGVHSSECILKIGEVQDLQPTANLILGYKEELVNFILRQQEAGNINIYNTTINDFVTKMLKELPDETLRTT